MGRRKLHHRYITCSPGAVGPVAGSSIMLYNNNQLLHMGVSCLIEDSPFLAASVKVVARGNA